MSEQVKTNAFDQYQEATNRTSPPLDDEIGCMVNFSMGLSGESGEITDYVKKVVFQGHPLKKEKIAEELGDLLWYVARMASLLGYDLSEIAQMNIEKLKKRYPDGFSVEASVNRVE
jgi:NTP pyrophosphatase (non-canonical NTP hydrolase)